MELIFVFLGAFITSITLKKVIEEYLIGRIYTKKTARIIGFENPVYNAKDLALSEGVIYPILEVQEKNKIIKLIIPIYQSKKYIKEGETIEIVYPNGKIESSKIYKYEENLKVHYLSMISGLIIIIISTIVF